MDDLEFIKRDVNKQLHEGVVFNDCGQMLRSMMLEIREVLEMMDGDPDVAPWIITDLRDLYEKYSDASVR